MCKGVRRTLTKVYQCVHLLKKGLPLNACYLKHHLCYCYRGCYSRWQVLHFDESNHHVLLYCFISIHLKTCLRQRFLCTGFCHAGFSWAVLISPEVSHIPYSHQEETGEPRWLCSHLWLFNWDGSSMLGCPGISFFHGVPAAGWLGIFL